MTIAPSLRRWVLCGLTFLLAMATGDRSSSANTCDILQDQFTQAVRDTRDAGVDLVTFEQRIADNARDRVVARDTMDEALLQNDRRLMRLSDSIERAEANIANFELAALLPLLYSEFAKFERQREILKQTKAEMDAVADRVEAELTILKAGAESRLVRARQRQSDIRSQMGTRRCGSPAPWTDADTARPVPTLPVPPRQTPQASLPDTSVPQLVPPVASAATCAEARSTLAQHVQAVEMARRSGNDDRGALANMRAAMAMTETICDRETAAGPEPVVATPGDTPTKGGRTKGRQPKGGQPKGRQPTAIYPPAGTQPQTSMQPAPVYQPPRVRTTTVHPPKTNPKAVNTAQPKTIRRPPPINTRVVRQPPTVNTRVVRPPIAQPRTVARQPAPTTRCRYVKGSIPKCDTR